MIALTMRNKTIRKVMIHTGIVMTAITSSIIVEPPIFSFANTSQEILQEKEKVNEEIEKVTNSMRRSEKKIEKMKTQFERTERGIDQTNQEITTIEERIKKRSEIIGARLSSFQEHASKNGGIHPYLQVVFDSDDFGDFISRVFTVSKIIGADKELLDTQIKDVKQLNEKKRELILKKIELENQFQTLQEEYEKLEIKKTELEALLLELEDKLTKAKKREERARRLAELQNQSFDDISFSIHDLPNDASATEKGMMAIEEASKYLGGKYVWGGASPKTSFDCSGYTQWAYKQAGLKLPRTAAQQYLATERVNPAELIPGDLVFFSYGKGISHVGIYIGDGKMMNAQNSGIKIASLNGYWKKHIAGFGRVSGIDS